MRHLLSSRFIAICGLLANAVAANAQVASSFDSGLDGWAGSGGSISFVPSGGNSGGFLQQVDTTGSFMSVIAPAKFVGSLSSYLGGTLSFDAKNISNLPSDLPSPGPWFGTVTITGAAGSATATLAGAIAGNPPPDGQWHTYSAQLDNASWGGGLASVLSNVTGIAVQLEFNNVIVETAGFDNFKVSPVPEPSAASFLLLGLGVIVLARKKVTL